MTEKIEIKGTLSKSQDVFFFTASLPLLDQFKSECHSKEEAQGSELFMALFKLPWVKEAAAEGRALIVKKKEGAGPWEELAPTVASIIRELHQKQISFFSAQYIQNLREKKRSELIHKPIPYSINKEHVESPLGVRIQKILNDIISPSLAAHGGYAQMVDLVEGKVYLYFGGGCQGCSQASVTVKDSIEKLLLKEFPELSSVVDVTDHSKGTNPYFS